MSWVSAHNRFEAVLQRVTLLATALATVPVFAQISHIEFGAGNYQTHLGDSPQRFAILEETTEELVRVYGASGVIYLNDYFEDGAEMAANHLRTWLTEKGYENIQVETKPGDYGKIDLPLVKTAHLSNPGSNQLPTYRNTVWGNLNVLRVLLRLANTSGTGLRITSYFYRDNTDYMGLLKLLAGDAFIDTGEVGYSYRLPDGVPLEEGLPDLNATISKVYYLHRPSLGYLCANLLMRAKQIMNGPAPGQGEAGPN